MCTTPAVPFVVGQWVRGESFYGREAEIAEVLDGSRNCLWLLGTSRIGKTSLLKQLELLTASSPEKGFLPLFWDLQGADSLVDLNFTFQESLLDAEHHLEEAGIKPDELRANDLFISLGRLRRQLRSRKLRLLLLCDEAEELIQLGFKDPSLLGKLRRVMQSHEEVRTVLASTIRLWALAQQRDDTSPFLLGFTPPLYLRALRDDEAGALISQTKLPAGSRPAIDDEIARTIRERCDNYPYLLQLLCKRYLEVGDVEEAFEQLSTDSMVASVFSSDLETLSEFDVAILDALSENSPADTAWLQERLSFDSSILNASLLGLENLGLVHRDDRQRFVLVNPFLRRWLRTRPKPWSEGGRVEPRPPAAARTTEIVANLSRVESRSGSSPDELLELVYDPLRELAGRYLRRERLGHTLQPTALVHEAYLKLVDQSRVNWKGRTHFFAVGAKIMRRILIDYARTRKRAKRGGDWLRITLTGLAAPPIGGELDSAQILALHAALERLAAIDERQARVVELRFFAGLNMAEVAEALGVSKRTVDSDWARARDWLEREFKV